MRRIKTNILYFLAAIAASFAMQSCQQEIPGIAPSDEAVKFGAFLCDNAKVGTRAYEGLDRKYITADPFGMDFYIRMNTLKEDGTNMTKTGVYVIPSGYEGRLEPKDDTERLDWETLNKMHTFHSWNMTWQPDEDVPYEPDETDLTKQVYFHNSIGEEGYDEYHNNNYLENFIGTEAGPVSYNENGKYIDLTFFHLVSRIKIGSFVLIQPSGAIQENLKADITFINMPKSATFNPVPDTGRPVVTANESDTSVDDGVTYYIANRAGEKDIFYICPEVNFSNVDYKIELKSLDYKNYKTYYGTFDEVTFERIPGMAYDQGSEIDPKTLHAGEEMTLNIVLIPGVGPGLKVVIDQWNTDEPNESLYHTYPGIYSEAEMKQFRDLLLSITTSNIKDKLQELESLWEIYGTTDEEGNKVFNLYDNIVLPGPDDNIFPVWRDYIVNGMGHTITERVNYGNYFGTGKSEAYFNTGPVRDVYFTDASGNNTIYIDKEGYVWVTNKETGLLEKTQNQLPELDGNNVCYDIVIETGQVRMNNYFSPNMGSYNLGNDY